jgi:hypothetical protein
MVGKGAIQVQMGTVPDGLGRATGRFETLLRGSNKRLPFRSVMLFLADSATAHQRRGPELPPGPRRPHIPYFPDSRDLGIERHLPTHLLLCLACF